MPDNFAQHVIVGDGKACGNTVHTSGTATIRRAMPHGRLQPALRLGVGPRNPLSIFEPEDALACGASSAAPYAFENGETVLSVQSSWQKRHGAFDGRLVVPKTTQPPKHVP